MLPPLFAKGAQNELIFRISGAPYYKHDNLLYALFYHFSPYVRSSKPRLQHRIFQSISIFDVIYHNQLINYLDSITRQKYAKISALFLHSLKRILFHLLLLVPRYYTTIMILIIIFPSS